MRQLICYVATTLDGFIAPDDGSLEGFVRDEFDKLTIKLNPVLFGSGISLFSQGIQQTDLELTDSKIYKSGQAVLHVGSRGDSGFAPRRQDARQGRDRLFC